MTDLRRRKENAYTVDLELEERTVHLQASPQAIAWDLHGNRLLYHRADWHYRIVKGSDPEEIVDWGRVDAVVCALAAAAGPLIDVAQGQIVAQVASDPVTEDPGWSGPRIVEQIAADPVQGRIVVYSHREDVQSPYRTDLIGFDASGGIISSATLPQPLDDSPPWHVPHAILYDDTLYAIERDDTTWPDIGPATGRVVKRIIGSLGAFTTTLPLPEAERHVFLHTLAHDPEAGVLYVFATRLNNPGGFGTYQTSTLSTIDAGTLALLHELPVDFDFDEHSPTERPYYLGTWEAAGGPNTGGLCVFDGLEGDVPRFLSAAIDPSGYSPNPLAPKPFAVFRWLASTRGTHEETLGPVLPVPLHRTGAGLIGAWQSTLPPAELEV
jgi:hypothetical protein